MRIRRIIKILILAGLLFPYESLFQPFRRAALAGVREAPNSVLSNGIWLKLGVIESGIYRLDYEFFQKAGMDIASVDPKTIKIFGNGCFMLPQAINVSRYEDLKENRIYVGGEADGRFDVGDYVLFYGQSPHLLTLTDNNGTGSISYQHNLYSDTAFYFLTFGNQAGIRVAVQGAGGAGLPRITSFDELIVYEADLTNILGSGREWYGEKFDAQREYSFNIDIPGVVQNSFLKLVSSVMGQSYSVSSMDITINDYSLGSQVIDPIPDANYALRGQNRTDTFSVNTDLISNPGAISLSFRFNKALSGNSVAYLNYFILHCKRELAYRNEQMIFRSAESLQYPESEFVVMNPANGVKVWDITDPLQPAEALTTLSDGELVFTAPTISLRTFILFDPGEAGTPVSLQKIPNQDLHGEEVTDFLIITHDRFLHQARRIAGLRSELNGLSAQVVTTSEIYNEFSSGALDVTAVRDYIRYLWEKAGRTKPGYVLLFGKGTYDYKGRITPDRNMVPVYESRNSLHPIFSYASDDYYAFLEEQEGDWLESGLGDHTMDLAIGRIPVVTVKDAEIVADKLIRYETGEGRFGEWRTRLCFVADDGDGVDGVIHQRDADMLAAYVDTLNAGYSVKKIFVDAYPQELFPSYQVAPEANRDLVEEVNNGLLIINYTGHGNEYQWTSEALLDMSVISNFTNRDHLPLFVTATCEFGRHDDPRIISGAETALFNERGGAIGLVTTSRPVFSSTNFILNKAFYDHVFERDEDQYLSIGEVLRRTKNESLNGSVNRNFSLLGDPSMVLAYPSRGARITRINGIDLDSGSDTLEALQLVSIDGEIADANGIRINDFDGSAIITVFDKPVNKKTLGAQDPVMSFKTRDNILFKGTAGVKNGTFRSEFIVPKNINYQVGDGRIMLYSVNEDRSVDAGGSATEFKVGGTAEDFPQDKVPPEIRLYLYDSAMAESEVIGTSPVLIARLYDESGISSTSYGLEKGITAKLDDQEFDLSRYYTADRDEYKSGTVNFRFFNLAGGIHNLELTARDTYNNLGKGYIRFTVSDVRDIVIDNLINYPNPFNDETRFSFIHNRAGEDLEISLNIYNMNGERVSELTAVQANSDYKIDGLVWNGANSTGEKLQPGIYAYHVTVRSLVDGAVNRQYQKLIIIY